MQFVEIFLHSNNFNCKFVAMKVELETAEMPVSSGGIKITRTLSMSSLCFSVLSFS